jgi:hypothetical protein
MANFESVTTSESSAPVKSAVKLQKLIDHYDFGELVVAIDDGFLVIYGYDWFVAYEQNKQGIDEDATTQFLKEVAKHLRDDLIIQSIGNEKCRFPLSAQQITVTPDGKITYKGF